MILRLEKNKIEIAMRSHLLLDGMQLLVRSLRLGFRGAQRGAQGGTRSVEVCEMGGWAGRDRRKEKIAGQARTRRENKSKKKNREEETMARKMYIEMRDDG